MTEEVLDVASLSGGTSKARSPWLGYALAGVTGGTAVILSVIAGPFVLPALRKVCLPYVPASSQQVRNVLAALKNNQGKTLVDLGSGDGRLVIASSKSYGLSSVGVELNPWLILYSRYKAWREGVYSLTSFKKHDLWTLNLNQYDNVVLFGVDEMMVDMESKLLKELRDEGQVIVCRFPLPSWTPIKTIGEGIDTVWVYRRKTE